MYVGLARADLNVCGVVEQLPADRFDILGDGRLERV